MGKLFSDIYGQKGAISMLEKQLKRDRLSHAYVVIGPQGTGKEYLARRFCSYILFGTKVGQEESTLNDVSRHPDFLFVNGRDGIKIEDIRNLIERISLSPNLANKKVALITEAENMGIEASNALLKTLEEPPQDTIIILTTISTGSIPETILSRGQQVKLYSPRDEEIRRTLVKKYDEAEVNKYLPYGYGNIARVDRMISDEEYRSKVISLTEDAAKIIYGDDVAESFLVLEKYEKTKELKSLYETLLLTLFGTLSRSLKEIDTIKTLRLSKMAEKILNISRNLDYNVNLKLELEEMILENI